MDTLFFSVFSFMPEFAEYSGKVHMPVEAANSRKNRGASSNQESGVKILVISECRRRAPPTSTTHSFLS